MSNPCALCGAADAAAFDVAPRHISVELCPTCTAGATGVAEDVPHWRCLNDAIWSPDAGVQVIAYRILHKVPAAWATDLLDIAYLEPDVLDWAQEGVAHELDLVHKDSNGSILARGDTVVLIKDLPVKGGGFTAKRGTAVRGISLVSDNAGHIEGRVEGQRIVILTEFVKKQ
jgi:protein PhnA